MHDFMYYFASTKKTFEKTLADLKTAVSRHGYGILHVHDLAEVFKQKDVEFNEQCQVFEVFNPSQAKRILVNDMKLCMSMPERLSVFTDQEEVFVGMVHPNKLLADLSDNEIVTAVAAEVDATLRQIIDDTK